MITALARRVGRLEATVHDEQTQRLRDAVVQLRESLALEDARLIRDWVLGTELVKADCDIRHPPTRFCLRCIEANDPPALVRAVWTMIFQHVEHATPVALPPDVARVYLDHPDARPVHPCSGCGYLLPARGGRLAFDGPCPVCRAAVIQRGR